MVASVYSAMDRFQAEYGGKSRFAAHIGFYTPCNVAYEGDTKVGPGGTMLNAATGQPYSLRTDPCVAVGTHVGHNAAATEAARTAVLRFAQQMLGN